MKIYACSNWGLKFLGLLIDAWKEQGHEVQYSLGYDPKLHEESDLCFIDACDNNAAVASRNVFGGSRLAIRAIDIECWVGQPGGVQWEGVDTLIFGAKHIQELVLSYIQPPPTLNIVHIPFGVDLRKWNYRERRPGKKIAFVAHQWSAKGLPLLLQVMTKLPYELHILGNKSKEKWLHKYVEHMISELGLRVFFTESVDDVDEWLDDKDFLLVTSQKEAFSYVAAEAMAKGIKPVIHNFWGARDIWPDYAIWNTIDEGVMMILESTYRSWLYRDWIESHFSLDLMMQRINAACQITD